ncbi:MAG TPA: HAD-IA family hydrolase [Verrucomicrobiae bacterium]|nr:HAD-IA family hydrolase [Verrucomicrobiae bacterium]
MKSGQVRAVFFDVGGTLIHPWPSVGEIYAAVAKRHGTVISPDQAERAFHDSWETLKHGPMTVSRKDWWRELVFLVLGQRNEACFNELFGFFAHAQAWRLYPDALEALNEVHTRGLHVGVISNWDERLRPLLHELGIAPLLDSITVSCEVGAEKPDPKIFHVALRSAGVEATRALHVGDALNKDVRGAEAVGMKGVHLDREGLAPGKSIPDLRQLKL